MICPFIRFLALWLLLSIKAAAAATVSVSLGELDQALNSAREEPDAVQRLVLGNIQERLNSAGLNFTAGELLYQNMIVDRVVEDGCTSTRILEMQTDIALSGDTGIALSFDSLFDPLLFSLDLDARLDAQGRARQVFGFRLGECISLGSDSFDFAATGPLNLSLSLSVTLNPVWIADDVLRVTPLVTLDGQLREGRINVSVDDTILRSFLEDFIEDEIDELLGEDRIRSEIDRLQQKIDQQLRDSLNVEGDVSGFIDVSLPSSSDDQILALYELLTPQARFPLTESFLRSRRLEILAALILDDQDALTDLLSNAAECELGNVLQIPLSPRPVFQQNGLACERIDTPQTQGTYFSDSSCLESFEFTPTSLAQYCQTALNSDRLGNPESNGGVLNSWTLSPGTRFDLSAVSLQGKPQPYVQSRSYKSVATVAGECQLEMRVYTDQPNSQNRQPLIALHGGSWQRRGSGFLGIENMATHFVDQGFVVFAPFYRLIGDSDGPAACQNATLDEILADVNSALDWVNVEGPAFGATGKPVAFGQSAGGHLALSLGVNRPQDIDRMVLFYPPTDFADFIEQVQLGEYVGEQGQRVIEAVTASASLDMLSTESALVAQNSFPSIVAGQPADFPPVFLLHGESDSLLPFRQSVRLCNAYAGSPDAGPALLTMNTESARLVYSCDQPGSQLHLIAEGEHALDVCISDELCLAGSPGSAAATAESINEMLSWSADPLLGLPAADDAGGAGAPGLYGLFLLLLLPGVRLRVARPSGVTVLLLIYTMYQKWRLGRGKEMQDST